MIHKTAIIDSNAKITENVTIGAYTVIGPNVQIGDGTVVQSHVNITGNTTIGKNNKIYPFASIGNDPQDLKFKGEKSFLKIGNNNSFREYCNISLGTKEGGLHTVIGNNSLYMVNTHIGHDCKMGNNLVIANNAAIAGHCEFDDDVILGGNSAVLQFSKIGKGAMIGGMTGVDRDVLPYTLIKGNRSYYENINLIGLKRKGYKNSQIEQYKKIINELFKTDNLKQYILNLDNSFELSKILINFIEKKNNNRDICRPQL